jgi:hypothetical protein
MAKQRFVSLRWRATLPAVLIMGVTALVAYLLVIGTQTDEALDPAV